MSQAVIFNIWEHPDQPFRMRFCAEKGILTFEGMMLEDETMFGLIRSAVENVESHLIQHREAHIKIYFYRLVYADDSIMAALNPWFQQWNQQEKLEVHWFFETLSEHDFGTSWSQLSGIPFHFEDTEPAPEIRENIDRFNEKTANSGLYFRLASKPDAERIVVEASQHTFFQYVDFTIYFEGVSMCHINPGQQWTDDYNLQWVLVEWEEALEFCARHHAVMDSGSILIRWLIAPLEAQLGYIMCKGFTIESRWI